MRASLFLLSFHAILGAFLWVTLSGVLLVLGALLLALMIVVSMGYQDTLLLYLLGAREVRASDQKLFFEAASQEAYKLSVPLPRLYFYNGILERGFVFQTRYSVSIVLNKDLLEKASLDELSAICFELLLQVKKGLAPKRTRSMFLLGFISWLTHSILGLFISFIPFKEVRRSFDWFVNYLSHPVLEFLFNLLLGENYFRKLETHIKAYPLERNLLATVGMKLSKPYSYFSIPSRKIMELHATGKSRHFQNIMALEFLPHEWDYLFRDGV